MLKSLESCFGSEKKFFDEKKLTTFLNSHLLQILEPKLVKVQVAVVN